MVAAITEVSTGYYVNTEERHPIQQEVATGPGREGRKKIKEGFLEKGHRKKYTLNDR